MIVFIQCAATNREGSIEVNKINIEKNEADINVYLYLIERVV